MQQITFGSDTFDTAALTGSPPPAMQMNLWNVGAGGASGGEQADSMVEACLAFGRRRGLGVPGAGALPADESFCERYEHFAARTTIEERLQVVVRVASRAGAGEGTALTLVPFIWNDPAPQVAQTAAMEAALLVPLKNGDPLTGPKTLLGFAALTSLDSVRAAILGGLVLMGDRRVNELLRDSWRALGAEGRTALMNAWSGYALAAHVEFLIDWLEDAPEYDFGGIVAALAAIPERAECPMVIDVERTFPVYAARSGDEAAEGGAEATGFIVRRAWSLRDYGAEIAPRLLDLYRRESTPRVLHYALEAWGIEWRK